MKKVIKFSILIILVTSCDYNEIIVERNSKDKFSNFEFINNYSLLENECSKELGEIVLPFYSESRRDSIIDIYHIDANLFEKHYSKEENMMFEKYAIIIQHKIKLDTFFFGILKKHSELVFFNYLERFNILTFDGHLKYYTNFEFINKFNCGTIESQRNAPKNGIYYENKTFDLKKNNLWIIDSIVSGKKGIKSSFLGVKEFSVLENKIIKSRTKELKFYFKNYTLFITDKGETKKHWIVSLSSGHKILYDENGNYIFLTSIPKVVLS